MMTTFSTTCKPVGFYTGGEPPLAELEDKFGSHLEGLTPHDKLILLAAIATNIAFHDRDENGEEWSLFDTYQELPCNPISDELVDTLGSLDNLQRDNLLGLCEALVAQVRYKREVAS